jgi:hypothetical protein
MNLTKPNKSLYIKYKTYKLLYKKLWKISQNYKLIYNSWSNIIKKLNYNNLINIKNILKLSTNYNLYCLKKINKLYPSNKNIMNINN